MKTKSLFLSAGIAICLFIVVLSCSKDYEYNTNSTTLDISEDFDYEFTTAEIGKLGRVLFYDNTLSINNSISCGSCHKQAFAFSDNVAVSKGFENISTSRNTPPIQNLGMSAITLGPSGSRGQALFWDGRERLLKNMVVQPVFNHVEMGIRDTEKIVAKVASKPYYEDLFIQAFGDGEITFERVAEALTGFVSSITTISALSNSSPSLSPQARKGLILFNQKYDCGSCHDMASPSGYFEPSGEELINIGLDDSYVDNGKGDLTGNPADNGKFKIPNLRNVAITAPYMHDGRFETLDEVLEHYSKNVKSHPNLDDRLKGSGGKPLVLNITDQEKKEIIAFLESLTDQQMISHTKYSDPFKKR